MTALLPFDRRLLSLARLIKKSRWLDQLLEAEKTGIQDRKSNSRRIPFFSFRVKKIIIIIIITTTSIRRKQKTKTEAKKV